jgi:hypothetical protein
MDITPLEGLNQSKFRRVPPRDWSYIVAFLPILITNIWRHDVDSFHICIKLVLLGLRFQMFTSHAPTHGPNIGRLVDQTWWLDWGDQGPHGWRSRCKIMPHFYGRFCSFCLWTGSRATFCAGPALLSCRGGSVVVGMIRSSSFQSCTMLNHGASFWGMNDYLKWI